MKHWITASLIAAASSALAAPATSTQPLQIGEVLTLASTSLQQDRSFNVVLPASYAKEAERRYPVLYLIDGGVGQDLLHISGIAHLGALWGRSAEAIVVGIETRDRRKELIGPTRNAELLKEFPSAGSAPAFRSFLRDEVMPLVRSRYRGNGHEAVIGESLAGLFIVETYLLEPELFDAYAAIDPSLWWDDEARSRIAADQLAPRKNSPPLYLAMAKEQSAAPTAMTRISAALAKTDTRWCLAKRPDLLHATIYQQVSPQALQFLLPPAEAAPAEYGFELRCEEPRR